MIKKSVVRDAILYVYLLTCAIILYLNYAAESSIAVSTTTLILNSTIMGAFSYYISGGFKHIKQKYKDRVLKAKIRLEYRRRVEAEVEKGMGNGIKNYL